jgi:hypothetical protein
MRARMLGYGFCFSALQELPMSASLFALLMLAAFLHASWNAMIKAASSAWFGTVLVAGLASLLAMCALPFLPAPMASWPYIVASVALQVLYLWLIARSYRVADMGLVYPLMRVPRPCWWRCAMPPCLASHWAGWLLPVSPCCAPVF